MTQDNLPTVTVLIPTFNRSEKLKKAIESVQAQTYQNIIIAIFDNASTDNTQELVSRLSELDERIQYFRRPLNIGMNANFNEAVKTVETPYFSFLSDDDFYDKLFIESAIGYFSQHSTISFVCFEGPAIDSETGNVIHNSLNEWPKEGVYEPTEAVKLTLSGNHFIISACLFRQNLIHEMHFDNKVSAISDLPIIVCLASKYRFYLTKKIGMYFIRHQEANGASIDFSAWSKLDSYINTLNLSSLTSELVKKLLTPRVDKLLIDHLNYFHSINDFSKISLIRGLLFERRGGWLMIIKFYLKHYHQVSKLSCQLLMTKIKHFNFK